MMANTKLAETEIAQRILALFHHAKDLTGDRASVFHA